MCSVDGDSAFGGAAAAGGDEAGLTAAVEPESGGLVLSMSPRGSRAPPQPLSHGQSALEMTERDSLNGCSHSYSIFRLCGIALACLAK